MAEDNKLIPIAMQIILHAGNARNKANEALDMVENDNYQRAKTLIKEAHEEITKAHQSQTDVIQGEAAGKTYAPCVLFSHAQDTLMTIMTEVNLSERLITLFEIFNQKLTALGDNSLIKKGK